MATFRRSARLSFSGRAVRKISYRTSPEQVSIPRSTPDSAQLPHLPPPVSQGPSPESDMLIVTLPVPPSINHQYATVNGRRVLSSVGRAYKVQVGQLLWLKMGFSPQRTNLVARLQSEWLILSVRFYFTSALRRDIDGGLKIAQDALCERLGINDNRIIEIHLYKHVDKMTPRIDICLAPVSPH